MIRYLLPLIFLVVTTLGAGGVYHACVNDATGVVRIVESGGLCTSGETYVTWGAVGLQGPTGPQGPAGAQGPVGPAGPQGIGDLGCTTGQLAQWDDATTKWVCIAPPNTAALEARIVALETKLAKVSVEDGGNTLRLTGANLQIVNGMGVTENSNTLGNLILGYNEMRASNNVRIGSHNLVLGRENNYYKWGSIVSGVTNTAQGAHATVIGGTTNSAAGNRSVVIGGVENIAGSTTIVSHGVDAVIAGGKSAHATGEHSSIFGGVEGDASHLGSTVVGGFDGDALAEYALVAGGFGNDATAPYATALGGQGNVASANGATTTGGRQNNATHNFSVVGGGLSVNSAANERWYGRGVIVP